MNDKNCISIQISLKFGPEGPLDNKSMLVKVTAWTNVDPVHWRIYVALGGDELKQHTIDTF